MSAEAQRCGYVALVGRPNVGKSTLLNQIVGRKLSITSRKPQTTRHTLLGVDTVGSTQAIYVDTPGIHDGGGRATNRYMVRAATSALHDVDIVVLIVERLRFSDDDQHIVDLVARAPGRKLCVINKIDQLEARDQLLPHIAKLDALGVFEAIIPISALHGNGVEQLKAEVLARLPESPHLFPPDQVTDRSVRFIAGEIVREKLMRRLGDELPHRITVVVERYVASKRLVEIDATIFVESKWFCYCRTSSSYCWAPFASLPCPRARTDCATRPTAFGRTPARESAALQHHPAGGRRAPARDAYAQEVEVRRQAPDGRRGLGALGRHAELTTSRAVSGSRHHGKGAALARSSSSPRSAHGPQRHVGASLAGTTSSRTST